MSRLSTLSGLDAPKTPANRLSTAQYTYKVAGPQVLVEREVIERLLEKAGMVGGDGMFTPGGSLSNLCGMVVARNEATEAMAKNQGREGGIGLSGQLRVYVSAVSHYSVTKNAGIMGTGRGNVVKVAADSGGRMRAEALQECITADRAAGFTPMMVVATAGTTIMGAFDDLEAVGAVATAEKLWLHVDGAFGGTALMNSKHAELMRGLDAADSLTWDPHKMMGVPITCSVLLMRRKGLCVPLPVGVLCAHTDHRTQPAHALQRGGTIPVPGPGGGPR